jgi:threonine/homoserine/homoserine lactone efflux protein
VIAALLAGFISGIVLSIPPGPLSAAVVKHSISHGFRSGLLVALAGALMDILYVLVAAFASSALVSALVRLVTGNGEIMLALQVVCILGLVVMGIRYMRHQHDAAEGRILKVEEAQEAKARKMGYSSPFLVGVLIAVANLASPTFIPSMIGVISYIEARHLIELGIVNNVVYAIGFGVGTAFWFAAVSRVLSKHRRKFSPAVLTGIYRFAGGTFIVCAAVLTYHVVISTDWMSF